MKNVKFILLAALIISLAGLSSCKKEDQIRKNLSSKGGVWNIDTYDSKETSSYFEEDNNSEIINNFGTITFNENGTGSIRIIDEADDYDYTGQFTYVSSEDEISINDKDGVFADDGETVVFKLDWKKNKMTMKSYKESDYTTGNGAGGTVSVHYTKRVNLTCSKK